MKQKVQKKVSVATWYQGERSGANWGNYFVLFVKYYQDNNSNRNRIVAT